MHMAWSFDGITLLQGLTLFVAGSDTICYRFKCSSIGLCKINS
jgi:hypothetical protein